MRTIATISLLLLQLFEICAGSHILPPNTVRVSKAVSNGPALLVTWVKPGTSRTIYGYQVRYGKAADSIAWRYSPRIRGSLTTSYTIAGLLPGTSYAVSVRTIHDSGYTYSPFTSSSLPSRVTTFTGPSQVNPPTVTKAVSSGRPALIVSWSAPQSDRTISKYELQYRKTPSGDWMSRDVTSTSYTLINLDAGTEYAVSVRAISDLGNGLLSSQVKMTTYMVPSEVSRINVIKAVSSGKPALTVSWSAPQSDRPITKYELQYRNTSSSSGMTRHVTSTSTALLNLDAGTEYAVSLRAVSDSGNGLFSTAVKTTTYMVPSEVIPPTVTKTVSSGKPALTVSWNAPQSDRLITKYELQYRDTPSGNWMSKYVTSTSYTLINLDAGTEYFLRVRAVSDSGNGLLSSQVNMTTYMVPFPIPTPNVTQFLSHDGPALRVSWSRPISELAISRYDIGNKLNAGTEWTVRTSKGYSSTSTVISNVEQSILYDIRVRALSPAGWSIYSNTTGYHYRVPSAPVLTSVQPVVSSNSVGLTVQWTPNTSERPITSYDVEYRSSFGKPRWELRTVGASTTTTTFDSLEKNTTFRVRVAATSDVGTGPPSAEKEATTFGVPSLDEVCAYPLPKPGSVRMAWTRASFTQPAVKLQSYSIQSRKVTEQGGSADFKEQLFNSTSMVVSVGDTVSAEVHGLNLGDVYDVKVALLTNAGIGEYSELVNVTTYPDSCSQCSEIRAVTFVMFQADRMKVSEEQSMVLVDVYRQGPMETPLTLRVKDIPGTAKRGSDYLLQSRDVVFLNTDQRLEKTSIVVRIRNDEVVEQGSPESFTLVLYSDDVDSRVVFTVSELTITIKDDD